ncbi:hypothetical protein LIER_00307 [Lithospermum erythrorhizon]|uniref:Protein MIZU-KUSSEI 1 n=1 Tax=Lithospermum erythrorhizon TaxID=34254 RepID=A0AAV3NGY6_LITER
MVIKGEATRASGSNSCSTSKSPSQPPHSSSLVKPSSKRRHHKGNPFRLLRSVFRSLPIISPISRLPSLPGGRFRGDFRIVASSKHTVTGTLYGYRKGRICLSIQENPQTMPSLVLELAMQTHVLQKEMSLGMVRIALECEKRDYKDKTKLLDEPTWTMFCNGRKNGFGVKRDENENEDDLHVMEVLRAISMGAGVLPGYSGEDGPDGEIAYLRVNFERVVGSKDSETYYMLSPDGNSGPELSVFFVRL